VTEQSIPEAFLKERADLGYLLSQLLPLALAARLMQDPCIHVVMSQMKAATALAVFQSC
jgi:hypothetical protein